MCYGCAMGVLRCAMGVLREAAISAAMVAPTAAEKPLQKGASPVARRSKPSARHKEHPNSTKDKKATTPAGRPGPPMYLCVSCCLFACLSVVPVRNFFVALVKMPFRRLRNKRPSGKTALK